MHYKNIEQVLRPYFSERVPSGPEELLPGPGPLPPDRQVDQDHGQQGRRHLEAVAAGGFLEAVPHFAVRIPFRE